MAPPKPRRRPGFAVIPRPKPQRDDASRNGPERGGVITSARWNGTDDGRKLRTLASSALPTKGVGGGVGRYVRYVWYNAFVSGAAAGRCVVLQPAQSEVPSNGRARHRDSDTRGLKG